MRRSASSGRPRARSPRRRSPSRAPGAGRAPPTQAQLRRGLVDQVDRLVGQAVLADVAVRQPRGGDAAPRRRSSRRGAPRRRRAGRAGSRPCRPRTAPRRSRGRSAARARESRSILRYSASVVAPITRSSPRASSGLRMLAASIAPSGAPAPSTVWSSSTKSTILPSDSTASSSAAFRRCSNWPRNWAPAIMPDRSSATIADALERLGHLVAVDPQREALGDGGLADAGLADQHGVVLAAAGEDLDGLLDLFGAADDGVDAAGGGIGGQVTAELVERRLALGRTVLDVFRTRLAQQRRAPLGACGEHHPHRAGTLATGLTWLGVGNLSHGHSD